MKQSDEQFAQQAKDVFDESVESLDAATLSRLNRGRQAALLATSRPGKQWSFWLPATGVAAALMLAVVMTRAPGGVDFPEAQGNDLEILLSEESIDMFEELEFYSFMDSLELGADGDVG